MTTQPSQDALSDISNALEVNIPYINKYGLQLLVHVGRRESHTQLQPYDFGIGTLSVIPI